MKMKNMNAPAEIVVRFSMNEQVIIIAKQTSKKILTNKMELILFIVIV